jgi:Uma2 family endonuclease
MGLAQSVHRFSVAEYYALEEAAEYRSEFFGGEIFAMAGGSARHSLISANLLRELGNRLKGKPCVAYESNLRLKIEASGLRTYPDAGVYCGKLEFDPEDSRGQTALNPTVLFEVLSPSTEAYDRGKKAENYRQIPSLKTYVLVSQDRPHVEVFERVGDGFWRLSEASALEGNIELPCIEVTLNLGEIYERVEFDSVGHREGGETGALRGAHDAAL